MYDFHDPKLRSLSYEIAHQMMCIQRRYLVQAFLCGAVRGVARGLYALAQACVRLVQRLSARYHLQSDIRALQQFDDRMLADIGVSRHDVDWLVRNGRPAPAWRTPVRFSRSISRPAPVVRKIDAKRLSKLA